MPAFERLFSDAFAEFCFGEESAHVAERVGELLDELGRIIGNPFAPPAWVPSPTNRRIGALYRHLFGYVTTGLRLRDGGGEPTAWGDLASTVVASNKGRHSLERIADMLIGAMLAAHRVPAAACAWMLMLVADHPESLRTITSGTSGDTSTEVRRIVLESLRLFPATWMVARVAERPVRVAHWDFPVGHNFLMSPYVIHRDEQVYTDCDRFDPDRWREPSEHHLRLLTFGAGLHLCPGRTLAEQLLANTLMLVAENHSIERATGPVTPNPRTTLTPDGLRIRLRNRFESEPCR